MALSLVALMLCIYGGTIYVVTRHLRQQIRQQMVARDAEVLQAVALMQQSTPGDAAPALSLAEPAEQLALLLRISRLKGVIAARLYDAQGRYVTSFPVETSEGQLSQADRQTLRELRHHSRYYEQAKVANLFAIQPASLADPSRQVPLLEVLLPLHEPGQAGLLGAAQFFIDSQALSLNLQQMDRGLLIQSLAVFAAGGVIIIFGLGGALRRLQRQHLELVKMTERLGRANLELTMTAKTSAVGAVAAHLIHGLKNPLYGLHNLIASGTLAETKPGEPGWQTAENATHDLLAMIDASAQLLRNESAVYQNETKLTSVLNQVTGKLQQELAVEQVKLVKTVEADALLSGRNAALAALVLENLLRNALQASPIDGKVELSVDAEPEQVTITVRDEGPGFPVDKRPYLFLPCQSTKSGGMGIGLAISKQLANHLGGRLELADNPRRGCTFIFSLPAEPLPPPALPGDSPKMVLTSLAVLN